MEVRIVGAIHDENMLDELQSIAKVFVYEQRMKQFITPHPKISPTKKGKHKVHIISLYSQQPENNIFAKNKVKGFM